MKPTLYIAWRYIKSKSSQNVINIINRMSAFVLIVGGASLMIVLAGFAGLKAFSLSFSTFFDPNLKIFPATGKFLSISEEKISQLSQIEGIVSYSKVLEERIFLNHNQKSYIAHIKGVDANYPSVNQVDSILVTEPNVWLLSDDYVIVGSHIAQTLNLALHNTASPLQMIVPKSGRGSIASQGSPYREEKVLVSDYYRVTEDLDSKYVFASLELSQRLLGLSADEISGIELKIAENASEKDIAKAIEKTFGGEVVVKNRMQLNEDLYKMFQTENLATYLIFTLVLIVALFNLVGALIMMILDKQQNLKTLYALGLTSSQLKQIFFLQGFLISFIGALFGVLLGVGIAWLQQEYKFLLINPNSFMPIAYPIDIQWFDIVLVFFTIFVLGTLASWIGSRRVSENLLR